MERQNILLKNPWKDDIPSEKKGQIWVMGQGGQDHPACNSSQLCCRMAEI